MLRISCFRSNFVYKKIAKPRRNCAPIFTPKKHNSLTHRLSFLIFHIFNIFFQIFFRVSFMLVFFFVIVFHFGLVSSILGCNASQSGVYVMPHKSFDNDDAFTRFLLFSWLSFSMLYCNFLPMRSYFEMSTPTPAVLPSGSGAACLPAFKKLK